MHSSLQTSFFYVGSLDSVRIAMKTKDLTFSEMFNTRLEQASRSVCIQLQSVQEAPAVYHSCAQYGNVSGLYVGVLNTVYALVEFSDDESVQEFLNSASFFARADQVPIRSKFLYRIGRNQRIGRQFRAQIPFIIEEQDTPLLDGLRKCQTVSHLFSNLFLRFFVFLKFSFCDACRFLSRLTNWWNLPR